ncbi:MAG: ABC transporter permease [Acidobacteria bacterium]|nr:ABC transporter permease [Acidobacteriota bacterium]
MRFLLATARKDLRRIAREPVAMLVWLGIPVFVAVMMIVIFRGGEATPHGLLLIADEDGSLLSRAIPSLFSQGELGKMFLVEKVEQAAGRRRMRRGDASALLIVPQGFGDAILLNGKCRLQVVTNPSQRILPQIVGETVSILADGAFYLNAVAGDQLRLFAQPPPGGAASFSDATIANSAVEFNRLGASLRKYVDPPLIELASGVKEPAQPRGPNITALFFPSMLAMSVLFLAQGLSGDIWKERAGRTLRRLLATPAPVRGFLAGKLAAVALVLCLPVTAGLVCARWLLGLTIQRPLPAAAWAVAAGAALYLFLLWLQTFVASERAANLLANFCVFPFAMIGGAFFPFEMMPPWMAALGRRSPVGWAVTRFRALLDGAVEPAAAGLEFGLLLAACAILFLLASARLRGRFAV